MLARFGFRTGLKSKPTGKKRIWIHALSLGEVISAQPFVRGLKEQHKNLDIVFTASTKTGFDMAGHLLFNKQVPLADQLGYFPFDLGYSVKKISRLIDPDVVVIIETDLWPNFLYEMGRRHIPTVLINARLSNRSLRGYLFFKNFSTLFFSGLTQIMVQTALDKKRFQQLGIDPGKISVTGNIKFDQPVVNMDAKMRDRLKNRFGVKAQTQVLVAGSTHRGEETILCAVYQKLKHDFPGFLMILAPRDPKRCLEISSYFLSREVNTAVLSALEESTDAPDVILVDTMGELSSVYAICDVAFIGGSMVAQGGHNPLEPASFSKPILFGKDMSDFLLIADWLVEKGGAKQVASVEDLIKELTSLLGSRQEQMRMGSRSFEVFSQNSGAVPRIIREMERLDIV